uniref:DUF3506 domain-containing protein n=1 Tax=Steinernema glaseri TaxID=37863 RepID=A0A1I7YC41_9BILA
MARSVASKLDRRHRNCEFPFGSHGKYHTFLVSMIVLDLRKTADFVGVFIAVYHSLDGPMTFLSTNRNEYDRIGLGCHLYGGIRFSAANPDIPGISPTQRYIAEHNLTRFWQAPHLDPHEVGFSQPVVRMRDLSDDGFNFMRPPGAHRADQPMMRLKRRNLLAGAAHVSRNDTHIPLWMVDESTVRNRIFKLNVGLEFGQEDLPMVTTRVHQDSIAEECIASSDVVQLRTLKGIPNKIAARTVSNLELCGPDMAEPHVLFGQFVDDLVQLPYMEDEMVISDRMGFVWHGKIGEALGRVKHAEEVQHICATDTPRVILAGSSFKLKVVDLREHATAPTHGNVLFEVDDGLPDLNEIEDANEILNNPMTICHVSPIPGQPCYSMLTTERFHFVLDHRMPKKPILEIYRIWRTKW